MLPKIEIKTKNIQTHVLIDGQELVGVRSLRFEQRAGERPVMTVEFAGADFYIDGQFVPALPKPFEKWYKAKTPSEMGEVLQG